MNFHIFLYLFISIAKCKSCNFCLDEKQTEESKQLLLDFCHHQYPDGRCCYQNHTNILTGVDLSNCSLQNLDIINSQRLTIKWLAINKNANWSSNKSVYRGFKNLSSLVIDKSQKCDKQFSQTQVKNDTLLCTDPKDACTNNDCPDNSNCQQDGPGLFACMCDVDWNGYRCLRKAHFPLVKWMVGFSAATILICITLGILQRKGLKNGKEYMLQEHFYNT